MPVSQVPECQEAAVLALFYPVDNEPHLIFIRRSADSRHHPGQIAFPGGRVEAGESMEEAAVRECHEEVGSPRNGHDAL
ncbi:CoA pyrophosphatase [bacterium]|nr:CoA pyrophosphatase [bacterium]